MRHCTYSYDGLKDRQLGSEEFSSPRSGNGSHELPEDYDSPFQERIQRGNRGCCSQELNWFVIESSTNSLFIATKHTDNYTPVG